VGNLVSAGLLTVVVKYTRHPMPSFDTTALILGSLVVVGRFVFDMTALGAFRSIVLHGISETPRGN
jgi:hypothetical protein